jgi:hypothetical protein
MTHDDKVLFRVTCNQKYDPVWAHWDEKICEAERRIKLSIHLRELLRRFSDFNTFRMVFTSEDSFLGNNPFNAAEENFLDVTLPISNKEIMFWRKLILSLQNNR